ncbi:MAG: hypothetical protein ABEH43_05300, partial [Flavobacteriales bacterium]
YVHSDSDSANGSVTLTLTSTNNGICLEESDSVEIEFTTIPTVDAGQDTTICANNRDLQLDGTISDTFDGQWTTSGNGNFVSSDTIINPVYEISDSDTSSGSVILTLSSTNSCEIVEDSITVTITESPRVDAGNDLIRCKNNPDAVLNGEVSGATNTGEWSTSGTGNFSPNDDTLDATYVPSDSDTAVGSVTLVLSSTDHGNCLVEKDSMNITYVDPPEADAGNDQTVCASNPVQLNGNIINGNGTGEWSTPNGTGNFSPSDTALDGEYHFSNADTSLGNLTFVLTSTNNGSCNPARDTMEVNIIQGAIVDAGSDQSVCENNSTVSLNGSVENANDGQWSTLGDGAFSPSPDSLETDYLPGTNDSINGSV